MACIRSPWRLPGREVVSSDGSVQTLSGNCGVRYQGRQPKILVSVCCELNKGRWRCRPRGETGRATSILNFGVRGSENVNVMLMFWCTFIATCTPRQLEPTKYFKYGHSDCQHNTLQGRDNLALRVAYKHTSTS